MLPPGTRLGPYEIVALIGSGGMGEVYRARDSRLGRDVAVKVIRGAAAKDPDRLQRFEQEARAAGLLNHPNVLAIYDIGTHEGSPYLVSELLEGETARLRLVGGPFQPSKVVGHATQIADGLAAAHEKGIVHRDLKPENLFITKDGRLKILDFGLAKLLQPDGVSGVDSQAPTADTSGPTVGTVSYMSPEQIRGQPVDHRSDIFSFGVVLYELLTGKRAFHGSSAVETMSAALREDPPGMDKLPAGLDLLVQHCIEKDPAHRFQSANDLAFHLRALSNTSNTGKKVPPLPRPPKPRVFTVKRALALVGTAALLVGALELGLRLGRVAPPSFHQLTFRRGMILSARFARDGQTIIYGAAWDGDPVKIFSTRPESPESRDLDLPPADVLAISPSGELAVSLGRRPRLGFETRGVLARVPLSGGTPREILTEVESADWGPDGRSLAVVHVVQGRYRLEYPPGKVLHESAGWLSDVRLSHAGTRIAFVEHPVHADDRGDICVVGVGGDGLRCLAPGWSSVTGLAWSQGDREVWFTAAAVGGRSALFAVDLSGKRRLVLETPGRLALGDISGGRALLIDSRFRLRVALRAAADAPDKERDLSWLDASMGADLSDDGRFLLISEQSGGVGTDSYAAYLRSTDGSSAIRLGDGLAQCLSPDGAYVALLSLSSPSSIVLLPTGAGENRTLPSAPLVHVDAVAWFPDGRRLLLQGNETGKDVRLYELGLQDPKPHAIGREGLRFSFPSKPISPDGLRLAAIDSQGQVQILRMGSAEATTVPVIQPGDAPIRWGRSGSDLYVFGRGELPARVSRVDVGRNTKTLVAEISPSDRAGVRPPFAILMTADERFYAYTYSQVLTDLYLVSELK